MRRYSVFSLSKNDINKNPNHQKTFFISCAQAWAYWPKSPLYRLSLRKSPIKKPRNIIQIRSDCQPDQTLLGSTKPNIMVLLSSLKPLFTAAIVIVLTPTGQELIPCVVKNYLDRLHQWKIFLYASTPSLN